MSPERAAKQIARGIECGRSRVLVGTDAWAVDKLVRAFPGNVDRVMHAFTARAVNRLQPDGRESLPLSLSTDLTRVAAAGGAVDRPNSHRRAIVTACEGRSEFCRPDLTVRALLAATPTCTLGRYDPCLLPSSHRYHRQTPKSLAYL